MNITVLCMHLCIVEMIVQYRSSNKQTERKESTAPVQRFITVNSSVSSNNSITVV